MLRRTVIPINRSATTAPTKRATPPSNDVKPRSTHAPSALRNIDSTILTVSLHSVVRSIRKALSSLLTTSRGIGQFYDCRRCSTATFLDQSPLRARSSPSRRLTPMSALRTFPSFGFRTSRTQHRFAFAACLSPRCSSRRHCGRLTWLFDIKSKPHIRCAVSEPSRREQCGN